MAIVEDEAVGNRVARRVLDGYEHPASIYDKQLTAFKGSRPPKGEFTVLAGIVALKDGDLDGDLDGNVKPSKKRRKVHKEVGEDELICLATGVKAVPAAKIEKSSNGRLVHDLHAESLAIRLFNLAVLRKSASVFEETKNGLKMKCGAKLAMYVSEIPCGDASLDNAKEKEATKENWTPADTDREVEILRGREFFGEVGRVRTKPGRRDSPLSLSKSCSDKLCMEQFTGLLNSVTCELVDPEYRDQFALTYLVLPKSLIRKESIERCFGRGLPKYPLTVVPTSESSKDYDLTLGKKPSAVSLVYLPGFAEVLSKGVRNGCSPKKIKPGSESAVSRRAMMQERCRIKPTRAKTYIEFKESQTDMRQAKKAAKETLGWPRGAEDNFDLD